MISREAYDAAFDVSLKYVTDGRTSFRTDKDKCILVHLKLSKFRIFISDSLHLSKRPFEDVQLRDAMAFLDIFQDFSANIILHSIITIEVSDYLSE